MLTTARVPAVVELGRETKERVVSRAPVVIVTSFSLTTPAMVSLQVYKPGTDGVQSYVKPLPDIATATLDGVRISN
jgi:hypothetical protein